MSGTLNAAHARSRPRGFHARSVFLFLNGIALGGLAALLVIRGLILQNCCIDGRWLPGYWDLADDLLPFYLVFGGACLLLALGQLIAWAIDRRTR